ncbi:hypothetical protein HQQ88_08225 [Curtobacterium sp. VKM Ac-2861]|uniref:hypothetical protein n=1 Tax=Curtobacterium sp. VKM Ac-2861 TaxID=2739016 RepID=UPI001564A2D7|nr:hypothetical protein [Curtobacterium sp. VKM Ac-2861]
MSELGELRTGIAAELDAALRPLGARAYPNLPDRLNPPLALVQPGSPYLEPATGSGFARGSWSIRHELILLLPPTAANAVQASSLDVLVEAAMHVAVNHGLQSVGQPYPLEVAGVTYTACRLQLLTTNNT